MFPRLLALNLSLLNQEYSWCTCCSFCQTCLSLDLLELMWAVLLGRLQCFLNQLGPLLLCKRLPSSTGTNKVSTHTHCLWLFLLFTSWGPFGHSVLALVTIINTHSHTGASTLYPSSHPLGIEGESSHFMSS